MVPIEKLALRVKVDPIKALKVCQSGPLKLQMTETNSNWFTQKKECIASYN